MVIEFYHSLDKLIETLVVNSQKTLKDLEEEIVDNDEIVTTVIETIKKFEEDRYNNDSIKDLKKDYPNAIEKIEEASLNYMGENGPKSLITRFPDKWKNLTKK